MSETTKKLILKIDLARLLIVIISEESTTRAVPAVRTVRLQKTVISSVLSFFSFKSNTLHIR